MRYSNAIPPESPKARFSVPLDQRIPEVWELGGVVIGPEDPTGEPEDLALPAPLDYGPPDVQLPAPAEAELGGEGAKSLTDIWEDVHCLQVLWSGKSDPAWSDKEQERVRRRSLAYRFEDGVLLRRLGNGEEKVVPPPAEREGVVQLVHEETGHWGEKRTVHLLKRTYWWAGMYESVRRGVAGSHQCDRTKAAFAKEMSVMQSLPIMGMGYRWSLDFAGPLITARSKKRFVLIGIEHFSKWCEVWALPSKLSTWVAEAFLGVMTRYGAC